MRRHLFSKLLSRVTGRGDATPVAIDPEDTITSRMPAYEDDDDLRTTATMPAVTDDQGDLYGVQTVASDRHLLDNDRSLDDGQNWIEALEERTAEGGPLPEHEIEIVEDNDAPETDTKDRPIADLGSGGRAGM